MTSVNEMMTAVRNSSMPHLLTIDQIDVKPQARKRFDDAENTIAELAENIKQHGVLQPILVRPVAGGRYELVAGERRLRAAKAAGLVDIPVLVKTLDDGQALAARLIENTHRLNLTQLEEAQELKDMLTSLGGNREALAKQYNKSAGWITQRLNLLDLTPQAQRLISEGITSDVGAINSVRQVEKSNPAAAKALVDHAASKPAGGNGGTGLRSAADAMKKDIKQGKPPSLPAGGGKSAQGGGTSTATPRDKSFETPGAPIVFGGSAGGGIFPPAPLKPIDRALSSLVDAARRPGADAAKIAGAVSPTDLVLVNEALERFYKMGNNAMTIVDMTPVLLKGFASNEFGSSPAGLTNLCAFLQGAQKTGAFAIERLTADLIAATTK